MRVRIKHAHFGSKLRSVLFGNGGAEGPARALGQCGLGIWIADRMRGAGPYALLPEARELDRQHRLIHAEANRLMDMSRAGQGEEAIAGFAVLQHISDTVTRLLGTMEARLRTEA